MNETDNSDILVLTRYLYPKYQVKNSLFVSLLEKNEKEALFWGYELYFSGFELDTINFVKSIFDIIYLNCNKPMFNEFINQIYDKFIVQYDNNSGLDETILGLMIWNIALRPYNVNPFIEQYMHIKCSSKPIENDNIQRFILHSIIIDKYKDIVDSPKTILKNACVYGIRNETSDIFMAYELNISEIYDNWLYAASGSPLWRKRIEAYSGIIDVANNTVTFTDEDMEEQFNHLYNYELDEQPLEIKERLFGKKNVLQLEPREFARKYKGNIIITEER